MQLFQNEGQAPQASQLWGLVMLVMEVRGKEEGKLRKQELSYIQSYSVG